MPEHFGEGQTLLVVEDDLRTLGELERILRRQTGLRVVAVPGPREALDAAESDPPDLALLDIRLPGMNGLELLGKLRDRCPDLMAIVMTGYREEATALESREKGAVDFLEKPLDLPYLLAVLRQQSRESALRRDLRSAAARLRRILERIPDGVLLRSSRGEILASNILGTALQAEDGFPDGERVLHEGRTYLVARATEGGEELVLWRDVTEALEAERGRAYRHMGRLLAHEIANPLTPMRLWLQDLASVPQGDPSLEPLCRQGIEVLLSQVERLSSLASRFKILGQEGPMEVRPVGLAETFRELCESLSPLCRQRGTLVEFESAPDLQVVGEGGALYQVLFNLLKNAVEAHAGNPGGVSAVARPDGGSVEIRIRDGGPGLSAEVEAALFTPYLTTKPEGTGLGLLVCRELLSRMGGSLVVRNAPGGGVEAIVRLPKATGQPGESRK